MTEAVLQAFPKLEIFNSCFTLKYSEWALGFCGGIYDKDSPGVDGDQQLQSITSLDLSNRCIHNLNNEVLFISSFILFSIVCLFSNGCIYNLYGQLALTTGVHNFYNFF